MISRKLDFDFYVNGLEAAILHLLKTGNQAISQTGMTEVKTFATYAGELDRDTLILALQSLAPRLPLVLASYGSGSDKHKAATGFLSNEPLENEHTCDFVVIVACNDLRGEKQRKVTAYKMVSDVRQLLGGVQFEIDLQDGGDPELLNHSPLMFAGVETIGKLKDLTAYAVHLKTSFKEWTPDRRVVNVYRADEILLDIEPNDTGEIAPTGTIPGVNGEII